VKIYRSLSLFVITLSFGLAVAAAQDQPAEPPKISITTSNQTAAEIFLTVAPRPDLAQPPGSPPVRMTNQANQVRALAARQIIPAHQSAQFDVAPGRYVVSAMLRQRTPPFPRPLNGLITVTNSETWLLSLHEQTPAVPGPVHAQQLVLQVPSRPDFRLTSYADRSIPPRAQRTNSPPFGTNSLHVPFHELKLPPTNH
jgi:hypothetical protein